MKKVAIYQQKRVDAPAWYNRWIQSPTWLAGFGILVIVCLIIYAINTWLFPLSPGSPWGIGYGISATTLYVCVMLYALRRKSIRVKGLERAWAYLQFHVYGGTLFLLCMFMHINFQLPAGTLGWALWICSIWIVLSGFLGSALQKWIPRLLNTSLNTEVNFDRIPELLRDLQLKANNILTTASNDVKDLYKRNTTNELDRIQPRPGYLFDPAGSIKQKTWSLEKTARYSSAKDANAIKELTRIYQSKLELDVHYTLQHVLRGWLSLHIPFSLILLLLIAIHIAIVLYY